MKANSGDFCSARAEESRLLTDEVSIGRHISIQDEQSVVSNEERRQCMGDIYEDAGSDAEMGIVWYNTQHGSYHTT